MKCHTEFLSSSILVLIWTLILLAILLAFSGIANIPSVEAKYVFSNKWGALGTDAGKFNAPLGIAVDSSGRVYVADSGNNRIQVFRLAAPCPTGTTQIVSGVCFVRTWGTLGTGNGQFNKPVDVALDSSGRIYVADAGNKRVQLFRANGAFLKAWNSDGPSATQFKTIVGVALDTNTNDIYVAEGTVPGLVHKFRLANPCATGTTEVISGVCFIAKWTFGVVPSHPPDAFEKLGGVAVNSTTHEVYVSDSIHVEHPMSQPDTYSIIKNTGNGIILGRWGGDLGSGPGEFYNPTGLAVDSSGRVYVADTFNNRIQAFKIQKFNVSLPCPVDTTQIVFGVCLITKWGTLGSGNGQFNFPSDVAVASSGLVYVADTGNNRIQQFYWRTEVGGTGGVGGGISPNIGVK
jgi:NHL repeat-containing protein